MIAIAVRSGHSAPQLLDLSLPGISAEEVRIRTLAVGVCGTDLHIIHSGRPNTPPGQDYLVLGHEGVGIVDDVGSAVSGIERGMLVVPCVRRRNVERPYRPDFDAFREVIECGINRADGFAREYWVDKPGHLYPAPPELGVNAVLTETFTVSEKAINESIVLQTARLTKAGFYYRQPRVLVTGLGPIAFAAAFIAHARGFDVTIAGRRGHDSPQAQLARSVEISYLDTREVDFSEFSSPERSFDMVLEGTGNENVFLDTMAALAERGIHCVIGSERKPEPSSVHLSMLLRQLIIKNQIVFGVVNAAAPRDFEAAFADMLWLENHYPGTLARMITGQYSPQDYRTAYGERTSDTIKRIVRWDDGG